MVYAIYELCREKRFDPEDRTVLAKAHLAKSYALLVNAYLIVMDLSKNWSDARAGEAGELIDQAIARATEAGQIDAGLAGEVAYVVARANDLKAQTVVNP